MATSSASTTSRRAACCCRRTSTPADPLADAVLSDFDDHRRSDPDRRSDPGAPSGRDGAPRRPRRPAVAGGDPQRPAVDVAPLRGERASARSEPGGGAQRHPAGTSWPTCDHPSLVQSGTVWIAVGVQPGPLLVRRDHAERTGPRRPRHVHRRHATPGDAAVTGRLAGDPAGTMDAPAIYSDHHFHLQPAGSPGHRAAVGRLLVHERRSRRRHDDVDAAAVRRRHRLLRTAPGRIQAPAPAEVTSLSPGTLANGLMGPPSR